MQLDVALIEKMIKVCEDDNNKDCFTEDEIKNMHQFILNARVCCNSCRHHFIDKMYWFKHYPCNECYKDVYLPKWYPKEDGY